MDDPTSSPIIQGDLISNLPDDIICTILSYLNVEESARTSILSKRWHKLWILSSINISDESIVNNSSTYSNQRSFNYSPWIINTLSHIISTHPGPIHRCYFVLPVWMSNINTLVCFLRTLTQKSIRNLRVDCHHLVFPSFVLECKSLVDVLFYDVHMPVQLTKPIMEPIFPNVRKVRMSFGDIDRQCLLDLLSSTPITDLQIMGRYGSTKSLVIKSSTLQKLDISDECLEMEEVIIESAPNLMCLNVTSLAYCCKLMILNAPKLKELSCIDLNSLMFQVGSYRFNRCKKGIEISGGERYMHSLRFLAIEVAFSWQLKAIPYMLKCFPCLKTLVVVLDCTYNIHQWSREEEDGKDDGVVFFDDGVDVHVITEVNVKCLSDHLKNVKLECYRGWQTHMDFAKFIVSEAKVLEKITLGHLARSDEEEWIETQTQFLLQNTTSGDFQVVFFKNNRDSLWRSLFS